MDFTGMMLISSSGRTNDCSRELFPAPETLVVALHLNRRLRYNFYGRSSALTLWPSLPSGNLPPTRIGHSR